MLAFSLFKGVSSMVQTNQTKANLNTYFADESWQPFNSTEGKFKVSFPKYPSTSPSKKDTNGGATVVYTEYDSESKEGDLYSVIYYYYPEIMSQDYDVKIGLEASINGIVASNNSNKLISSTFINVGEHQGADYVVYNGSEQIYLKGRVVTVLEGNSPVKAYLLMVTSKESTPSNNFTKFINSFEFL